MIYLRTCLHVLLATAYAVAGMNLFSHFGMAGFLLFLVVLFVSLWAINRALDLAGSRFRLPGL